MDPMGNGQIQIIMSNWWINQD
jgi:hypothetical protein